MSEDYQNRFDYSGLKLFSFIFFQSFSRVNHLKLTNGSFSVLHLISYQ